MEITDEVKTLSEKHLKTSLENNANHTAREPGPEKPGPEEPGPEKPGPEKPGPEGPGPEKPGPEKPGPDGPGPDGPRLEELTPVEETDDKSEIDDNSDEDDAESGDESDIEDNDQQDSAMDHLFPSQRAIERPEYPNLPDTVTTLETADGSKVYIVGTAHFSEESQADVAQTIQECKPDIVMVELCPGRVSILSLDEKTLLEEAKTISIEKLRTAIKQVLINYEQLLNRY
ncbi:uncharacterized protein LOC141914472 [Tubulanus polymorphus]|uniref:uncharacterized protein LOC141914472 n=1 Tax=Tubulanus polymorphus TaxID=672921 RepID=UPI003DA63563